MSDNEKRDFPAGSGPQKDVERLTKASADLHIVLGDMVDDSAPDKWLRRLYDVAEEIEATITALRGSCPTPGGERRTEVERLTAALQGIAQYRDHLFGCQIDQTDFCTCGMKQAADSARDALRGAATQPAGDGQ